MREEQWCISGWDGFDYQKSCKSNVIAYLSLSGERKAGESLPIQLCLISPATCEDEA